MQKYGRERRVAPVRLCPTSKTFKIEIKNAKSLIKEPPPEEPSALGGRVFYKTLLLASIVYGLLLVLLLGGWLGRKHFQLYKAQSSFAWRKPFLRGLLALFVLYGPVALLLILNNLF